MLDVYQALQLARMRQKDMEHEFASRQHELEHMQSIVNASKRQFGVRMHLTLQTMLTKLNDTISFKHMASPHNRDQEL